MVAVASSNDSAATAVAGAADAGAGAASGTQAASVNIQQQEQSVPAASAGVTADGGLLATPAAPPPSNDHGILNASAVANPKTNDIPNLANLATTLITPTISVDPDLTSVSAASRVAGTSGVPSNSISSPSPTKMARALWDYVAIEDNELSFKTGDMIRVLELCNADWYEGQLGSAVGYFPANRVVLVDVPQQLAVSAREDEYTTATDPTTEASQTSQHVSSQQLEEIQLGHRRNHSELDDPFGDDKEDQSDEEAEMEGDVEEVDTTALVVVSPPEGLVLGAESRQVEMEEGRLPPTTGAWTKLTDADGQTYYWNEETDQTSWDPPELQIAHDASSVAAVPANFNVDLSLFDSIPSDLIKKEGGLRKKVRKDEGGKDAKSGSWKSCYGILCAGLLIIFKEAPSSKSKKPTPPTEIIFLNKVVIDVAGKDVTTKKNALTITSTANGGQWIILPDSDLTEWMEALNSARSENTTVAEIETGITRIFSRQKSDLDVPLPTRGGSKSKRSSALPAPRDINISDEAKSKIQAKTKLGAFFAKKANQLMPTKKEKDVFSAANASELVFGGVLELQIDKEGGLVPKVVQQCCAEVERRGLTTQGIYRLSGNSSTVQKLKQMFNQGETVELDSEDMDINCVTGVLKLYFRELQNPLIPYEFYDQFIQSAKIEEYNERLITLKTLIQSLPQTNYQVLEFLMRHLCKVVEHSEVNKMEPTNIAIVFAPTLIRSLDDGSAVGYASMANMPFHNKLIESMLNTLEWLFDGSED